MNIIGISCFYHDSAAALITNGQIIAAAEEERFTRLKHDKSFPINSIDFCLKQSNISLSEIDAIVFYDRPFAKFERIIETVLWSAPHGLSQFIEISKEWLGDGKLTIESTIKKELKKTYTISETDTPKIYFEEHHISHAASAFFASPFKESLVLCIDGVGEWATTSCWHGIDNKLKPLWQIDFPHSIGLLYSAFTYFLGFKINDGEYKVMGLAPYGEPKFTQLILSKLVDLKADGSFRLNMDYFNFTKGLTMTNEKFHNLFAIIPRKPDEAITQLHMDIARSIQEVIEIIILNIARFIRKKFNIENLCLAGGVALNCVVNGKIKDEKIFKDIWIQPASGDSGGAIGAALNRWHHVLNNPRKFTENDLMNGAYLGPSYTNQDVKIMLDTLGAKYTLLDSKTLYANAAKDLLDQKVIGWFSGRMEFGPRSLGNRSILGDARSNFMQSILNQKIKQRESFRPFAPAILEEEAGNYFENTLTSPYMLFTSKVKNEKRINLSPEELLLKGIDRLKTKRSLIPAVTHLDYSARVQTVSKKTNPSFHNLISEFYTQSNSPIIINTSFNIRGEPIVCTPSDAFKCFMNTEMDSLYIENFLIRKTDQDPKLKIKYTTNELSPNLNTLTKPIVVSIKELKTFSYTMAVMFPVMGILIYPALKNTQRAYWTLYISLIFLIIGIIKPIALKPFSNFWNIFTNKIGKLKATVFLTLLYFFVLTPYGILLRIFINGQMGLKIHSSDESYYINVKD